MKTKVKRTKKEVKAEVAKKVTDHIGVNDLARRIVLDFWNNTQTIQKTLYPKTNGKDSSRKQIRERFVTVGTKFLGIDKTKANSLLNELLKER